MANVFVDDASLQAIAGAIRAKTGGTATYKPGQMAAAIQGIQTGGMEINAQIAYEQVAGGDTISSGQLVSFYPNYGNGAFESWYTTIWGNCFDVVPLDGERVFVAAADTEDGGVLNCCVVTVRPNNTVSGAICELQAGVSMKALSAVALDAHRVMVLYINATRLHCAVYQVIEDQVTVIGGSGESVLLEGVSFPDNVKMKSVLLGENRVLVLVKTQINNIAAMDLYVGSDMTVKNGAFISDVYGDVFANLDRMAVAALDTGSVLMLYPSQDEQKLKGNVLCNFGNYTALNSEFEVDIFDNYDWELNNQDVAAVKLTDGSFFVVYQGDTSLYGAVLSAPTGDNAGDYGSRQITVEASGIGLRSTYSLYNQWDISRATLLPDGRVLVIVRMRYEYEEVIIVTINRTENNGVSVETEIYSRESAWYPAVETIQKLLTHADGTVTAWYIDESYGVCMRQSGRWVGPYNGRIDGVAKTGGSAGETIEVYEMY